MGIRAALSFGVLLLGIFACPSAFSSNKAAPTEDVVPCAFEIAGPTFQPTGFERPEIIEYSDGHFDIVLPTRNNGYVIIVQYLPSKRGEGYDVIAYDGSPRPPWSPTPPNSWQRGYRQTKVPVDIEIGSKPSSERDRVEFLKFVKEHFGVGAREAATYLDEIDRRQTALDLIENDELALAIAVANSPKVESIFLAGIEELNIRKDTPSRCEKVRTLLNRKSVSDFTIDLDNPVQVSIMYLMSALKMMEQQHFDKEANSIAQRLTLATGC